MSRNGSGLAPAVTEGKARKSDLPRIASTISPEYKFHPLAALVPPMSDEEYETLAADIKANGLNESIVLHGGMILDGCHRYRACKEAGVEPSFIDYLSTRHGHEINDPAAYVVSVNIHRRHLHLTADQKRELIAKLIKAEPEKSDRQIAAAAKASPTYVGKVRSTVHGGQLPEKRVGKDGKARKQPAKKKAVESVRAADAAKHKRLRDERRSPGRPGENAADVAKARGDEKAGDVERRSTSIDTKSRKQPMEALDNSEDGHVPSSEVVGRNLRNWISQHHAGAEAVRKIIKAAHLEDGVRREIGLLITRVISKWKAVVRLAAPDIPTEEEAKKAKQKDILDTAIHLVDDEMSEATRTKFLVHMRRKYRELLWHRDDPATFAEAMKANDAPPAPAVVAAEPLAGNDPGPIPERLLRVAK
jgi:ParB-like chromosome segregation protein Spo0J